ncbi:Uncharacterised protein [Candidatus Norongarragalina meridionalis]|nr:Uncharacterised protein [Candidatus Norongarragalina meridionalis]
MMLAGAAIVGLLVGGFVGYWYANQNQQTYLAKGAALGCITACGNAGEACVTECFAAARDASSGSDYLQKMKTPYDLCVIWGEYCHGVSW